MKQNFNDVTVLFPSSLNIDDVKLLSALQPFANESIDFLSALSLELYKDPQIREFPDVATFAFYCRKANILRIKELYDNNNILRLGRGIVFHIAPSNVPVNFAYSLVSGILSGNINIVRVPSKEFEQVAMICYAIAKLNNTGNFETITRRIVLISYDRQSTATSLFSSFCDVRIIWGGDKTIDQIRKSKLPTRSFDITFADRYSICLINADEYIAKANPENIAKLFYNDTYLFDQNACTAPHLIVWLGSIINVKESKDIFWESLYEVVKQKYHSIKPVIAVDKLTALYTQAINLEGVNKSVSKDNLLWKVTLDNLYQNIEEFRCSSGYFSEYHANSLSELSIIINRKYQTLAYYGIEKKELIKFIETIKPSGIDRIVPIGRTTDFSIIWDGFDLINILSRCCEIL